MIKFLFQITKQTNDKTKILSQCLLGSKLSNTLQSSHDVSYSVRDNAWYMVDAPSTCITIFSKATPYLYNN